MAVLKIKNKNGKWEAIPYFQPEADQKYNPESTNAQSGLAVEEGIMRFFSYEVEETILEETTVKNGDTILSDDGSNWLEPNHLYRITWDGVPYECAWIPYGSPDYTGNGSLIYESIVDTGEPFCIVFQYLHANDELEHTMSIERLGLRLNDVYIPNSVVSKDDMNKCIGDINAILATVVDGGAE